MIRKTSSGRDRDIPPEPTSEELSLLVAGTHTRTRAGGVIKTYVLTRTREVFLAWVKAGGSGGGDRGGVGRKLQDCKYLSGVEDMRGVGFTSPLVEMLVIGGWENGRDDEFVEEGHKLISRYCLEKRVHSVPAVTV